jgi:hypothetical protein
LKKIYNEVKASNLKQEFEEKREEKRKAANVAHITKFLYDGKY